jgi:thioesterase domain-containing protein
VAIKRSGSLAPIYPGGTDPEKPCNSLRNSVVSMSESLLIPLVADGARPPFFIVAGAGSTPFSLVRLARSLKSQRPVYTFEFAGMESGHNHHQSIDDMASAYLSEIRAVQKSGPYYIGGHCWGGIVAFDMATKLEAEGETVAILVVLESFPPETDKALREREDRARAETDKAVALALDKMQDQIARLPAAIAERHGQFTRQQTRMSSIYRTSAIDAPIALLRTRTHPDVVFQDWNDLSIHSFTQQIVPGDAFSMLISPDVGTLAARLDTVLGARHSKRP